MLRRKQLFTFFVALSLVASVFSVSAWAKPSTPVVTPNAAEVQKEVGPAVPFDPTAPEQPEKGKLVEFTLSAMKAKLEVAPGEFKEVWTFNGSVPGPTLRVHQGDTVRFTLINKDPDMSHGLDFHAGQMDMGTYHKPIKPGESVTFDWKASYPGVFYYHCSADPVIMHIANGMFGAVIVDPPGYKPEGKEYVLIQHEWYENSQDMNALINEAPKYLAFNGVPMQYVENPLTAEAGERVRFYFVNAGINNFSAFHVIGTIFDKAYPDGNPLNEMNGVQTIAVAPGGAVITDLYADEGTYAILTHSMKDAMKGALGILKVGKPDPASSSEHDGHTATGPMAGDSQTADNGPTTEPATNGDAAAVSMKNFAFSPKPLEVKVGTTVTWTNQEASLHTVVGDSFDSRVEDEEGLSKGEMFEHTFDQAGTYDYHCSLHPFMTGTITVK